jgi:hypothetical protein
MARHNTIAQEGLDRFLSRLNQDRELGGEEYERVRGRLILYFQCRDIVQAEDCADEVINRAILELETGHQIRDLVTYYSVSPEWSYWKPTGHISRHVVKPGSSSTCIFIPSLLVSLSPFLYSSVPLWPTLVFTGKPRCYPYAPGPAA